MSGTPQERWARIEALFAGALDRLGTERGRFLDGACAGDPARRAELDRLLDAHEHAGGFLDHLDTERAAALVGAEDDQERGRTLGPYRIEGALGRGGMGVVYRAHDPRLRRAVALKVLPSYLSADEEAKARLLAEARAASALDHPNVGAVYDVGETEEGQLFLAMAYYEGQTLRERLRAGRLPVAEAVGLARQLASALAAAHERGIAHRDVKPANVIVTDAGVAKLVDFGIAKAAGAEPTVAGATPGTVAYMSPEQTRGHAVDTRSDLWSLGVVLYEILAGERPFQGDSDRTLIHAIRYDEPGPVVERRPETPPEVARAVERLLRKDPAQRYPSADALLIDLDLVDLDAAGLAERGRGKAHRLHGGVALLLALLLAGAFYFGWSGPSTAEVDAVSPRRLAVLPMDDMSAGPDDAYFAEGVTEGLLARFSTLSGLRVTARRSVMRYQDSGKDAAEIGEELGVEAVLEGRVRKEGNRARITLLLVEVESREPLWSGEYEATVEDVLGVQRAIAGEVAAALGVPMRAGEQRLVAKAGTDVPEAHESYLKGRYFLNKQNGEALERSEQLFLQALDLDPTYAEAWTGLADSYASLGWYLSLPPEDTYPRARAAAERALALDPDLAEAHAALAATLGTYYWDWKAAEHHYRRAVELSPNHAPARQGYAELLHRQGRVEEALEEAQQARELDPLSPASERTIADVLYHAGRYEEAVAHYEKVLRLHPGYTSVHSHLALAYLGSGRYADAVAALQRMNDLGDGDPDWMATLGFGYAVAGRKEDARVLLEEVEERAEAEHVSPFHRAAMHAVLGDQDRAFELLDQAYEERDILMTYLEMDRVVFSPLRSDPRFVTLLERVGLAEWRVDWVDSQGS